MAIRESEKGIENFLDCVIMPGSLIKRAKVITENHNDSPWDSDTILIKSSAYVFEAVKIGAYLAGLSCLY